ncbi:hypothetical protein F4778DRAFT_776410 [Xylariomycetidae sp. FL2044]|nr:hypothetical protein F4778DRAFT_776410 [Xylariomycetidae sp. FL2044]
MAILQGLVNGADSGSPNKQALNPAIDKNKVISGLKSSLPKTKLSQGTTTWTENKIPEICVKEASNYGHSGNDMEAYDVHLSDCSQVFVLCRHKKSSISRDDMVETFSQIPLGMRQYLRQLVVVPGLLNNQWAGMTGSGTTVIADQQFNPYILAHEIAHSLDQYAGDGSGLSGGSTWKDAVGKDSAVVSDYGETNYGEDFADAAAFALYDIAVDSGLKSLSSNEGNIKNQISTVKSLLGDLIKPGAVKTCNRKFDNGKTTTKSGGSKKLRSEFSAKLIHKARVASGEEESSGGNDQSSLPLPPVM